MLLVSMSFPGIAQAERKVYVEGLGREVSESYAQVYNIQKARRERAFAKTPETSLAAPPEVADSVPAPVSISTETVQVTKTVTVTKEAVETAPEVAAPIADQTAKVVPAPPLPIGNVVSPNTAYPVRAEKSGHSFDELYGYLGGYYALGARTGGLWTIGEWTHWKDLQYNKVDLGNFGAGLTVKADKGWGQNGSHWGHVDPGFNLDFYRGVTEEDDILLRFRQTYRFGEKTSGSGFVPGGYFQVSHILGYDDKIIVSADGEYFRNDSYLGLALMEEHRFNRDLKVRFGLIAGFNFLQGETIFGLGPEIVFDLYDRLEFGLSMSFAKGGPFMGAFAGYKVNSDLRAADAALREGSVKIQQQGTAPEVKANEVKVSKTATGDYSTMPDANKVTESEKSLDEQ